MVAPPSWNWPVGACCTRGRYNLSRLNARIRFIGNVLLLRDDLTLSRSGHFTHRNPVRQQSPRGTSGLNNALLAHGEATERHDRDIIILISPIRMSSNI